MKAVTFGSVEELFEWLDEKREAGREAAEHHHLKVSDLTHGDHFVSPRPDYGGLIIFGEVLEHTNYPEDASSIKMSRLNGYVYGRCYSVECVEGEFGDTHITNIAAKIPAEVFERAKANGWRNLESTN